MVDISVDTNGPIDLTNFHKNPYGFVDLKIARNGILKEVMFNNELISSERPFLSS